MNLREPLDKLIFNPNRENASEQFPAPEEIRLYDTTLRDGEQTPGVAFSPEHKLELARELSDLGIHILDLGFPGAANSEQAALKLICQARRRGEIREDLELLVMCRATRLDIDITLECLLQVDVDVNDVTFFIFTAGSDLHIKYKLGRLLLRREGRNISEWLDLPVEFYREANLRLIRDAISYAREKGVNRIEFGGEDGSRGDLNYLLKLAHNCYEAGGTRFSFPDTVGHLLPEGVDYYFSRICKEFPGEDIVVHFHNDFGMAGINTLRAMSWGVNTPTCTLNGMGERAGNTSLHQIVSALHSLYGIEIPGFRYDRLIPLRRRLEEISGVPVSPNEPVIGENVFTHESGIHTAGLVISPAMYQVLQPAHYGQQIRFIFGKHSGTAVVADLLNQPENRARLERDGVELNDELIKAVTAQIKIMREDQAASVRHSTSIQAYYDRLLKLGFNCEEVLRIALMVSQDFDKSANDDSTGKASGSSFSDP